MTSGTRVQPGDYRQWLGEIKSRVGNRVGGELVGSKLDMDRKRYRLRYLREGSVVEVDVDAKTGHIIDIDGN